MSQDPLHAPLRPRRWRDRLRLRASPAQVTLAIVLVALASLFVWAWLQPAPAPRTVVVERELPPRPAPAPMPDDKPSMPTAAQVQLSPPSSANTTTPSGKAASSAAKPSATTAGGARIIRVPDGPDHADDNATPATRNSSAGVVVDMAGAAKPLSAVPAPDLVERTSLGPLPRTGRKGRKSWRVYAYPVSAAELASTRPALAVLVVDLGLKMALTDTAMRTLPARVSLAFAPRGNKVRALGLKARRHGHEFFLQLPMEPWGYPAVNPGPNTLLASTDATANRQRLHRLLSRAVGYAGVVTYAGQKLLRNGEALSPILHELKRRGLLVVDDGSTADSMLPDLALVVKLPALRADVRLPPGLKEQEARALLEQARQQALERGHALLVVSADATNLEVLRGWLADIGTDDKLRLLPVTALARMAGAR